MATLSAIEMRDIRLEPRIAEAKARLQEYVRGSGNAHHFFVGAAEELADYDKLDDEDETD